MVLKRIRVLEILLTKLALEGLRGSMNVSHMSIETVFVEGLVTIRTQDSALRRPAAYTEKKVFKNILRAASCSVSLIDVMVPS